MPKPNIKIIRLLKEKRKQLKISQAELAIMLNISMSNVCKMESETISVGANRLEQWAKVLGCEISLIEADIKK